MRVTIKNNPNDSGVVMTKIIYRVNQSISFYMMATLAFNKLMLDEVSKKVILSFINLGQRSK